MIPSNTFSRISSRGAWPVLLASLLLATLISASALVRAAPKSDTSDSPAAGPTASAQPDFPSAEDAMRALIDAAKTGHPQVVARLFGSEGERLLSGDRVQDRNDLERFSAGLQASAQLRKDDNGYTILVGKNHWPFPIPIVRSNDRWSFDTKAGLEEILNRRIGQNELSAIATCRAYALAQWEFYTESGADTQGLAVYAQRFFSTPGHHDGLYWQTAEGEKPSPLGALVAEAREEGYGRRKHAARPGSTRSHKPRPFHGYIFKILTAQGPSAPGGKFSYIINGNMIAGYALVAYPSKWGNSGVMTFIINQQGRVYQKNLGPDTAKIAASMSQYNPDPTWQLVEQ